MSERAAKLHSTKRTAVHCKMALLTDLVREHGADEKIHYGHVGDLAYLEETLDEMIRFMKSAD